MIVNQNIHAGDTPLASTITIEQTGPMQLTVRAGSFTTTGEARIIDNPDPLTADDLAHTGLAEWLPGGVNRLRVWIQDANGIPIRRRATYVLAADVVFNLSSDPTSDKIYLLELGALIGDGVPDVLCRSQLAREALPAAPIGWEMIHWLSQFTVPAGAIVLDAVTVPVFTVLPGFPLGTSGVDWLVQRGVVS